MKRSVRIAAVILTAVFWGIAVVYGYFSDTVKVTNHIALGDVKIGLEEFEKKGGTEVTYRNPQIILPGALISKIPRITNYAMPCWVRAKIIFEKESSKLHGLDETMISGFSKQWVKRGEYYYCTEILKRKESVDLFQTVSVPSDWTELYNGQGLGISVRAEAIQAANFQPDFSAMSPWGNQKIQQCVHEQDGNASCRNVNAELSVELSGKAQRLMAVPGDFFANIGTAMPGDRFEDTVLISNTTDQEAEIFFRTSVEGQNRSQMELLNGISLSIYLGKTKIYHGPLNSSQLKNNYSLGIYRPGQEEDFKFILDIPAEWDNAYALRDADVQWFFSVNEQGSPAEENSILTGASDKDMGAGDRADVKTGDPSKAGVLVGILICSGMAAMGAGFYLKRRWKK